MRGRWKLIALLTTLVGLSTACTSESTSFRLDAAGNCIRVKTYATAGCSTRKEEIPAIPLNCNVRDD